MSIHRIEMSPWMRAGNAPSPRPLPQGEGASFTALDHDERHRFAPDFEMAGSILLWLAIDDVFASLLPESSPHLNRLMKSATVRTHVPFVPPVAPDDGPLSPRERVKGEGHALPQDQKPSHIQDRH
jgi:hypothetical protein